jgi:hypothetical protein
MKKAEILKILKKKHKEASHLEKPRPSLHSAINPPFSDVDEHHHPLL